MSFPIQALPSFPVTWSTIMIRKLLTKLPIPITLRYNAIPKLLIESALSLFASTNAATTITMTVNVRPMPILRRMLIPLSLPVTFRRTGTMILS
ncbi:hypothetical protein Ahy_A03g011410 isoform C [Arachis hypogaea]|uniref:Uncharacterized protein n=1 Tax=Arachis hypogaea TaxID=3818 RepID=A0A445DQM9_ARAHY|nr:hypothetical protein Ahy_A03g011410 isoform C [Arachis hypogaea]